MPAGLQRTYPNFITPEGVLGAEWNKMNREVTPRHYLMLPYTRMLAGEPGRDTPRDLLRSVRTVRSTDQLTLPMAAAGGAAVIREPLP